MLISIAAFGCGGGQSDESGGETEAEAQNQAVVAQAEGAAEDASQVEDALRLNLAPYYYAGVDQTFALADGSLCSIGEVYSTEEEVALWETESNVLTSPDGNVGIRVEQFQGTESPPCLKAVGEAMDWLGGEEEVAPESEELTKAEFLAEADSICRPSQAEVDRIFKGANTYDELARAVSIMRSGFLDRIETLEALTPPPELSGDFESYTSALRDEIEILDREQAANASLGSASSVGEKLVAADKAALKQAYDDLDANFETRAELAKSIGFKECSKD